MCKLCGDKLCVSKLCVSKLCGGRRQRRKEAARYRTKNKNPTHKDVGK